MFFLFSSFCGGLPFALAVLFTYSKRFVFSTTKFYTVVFAADRLAVAGKTIDRFGVEVEPITQTQHFI